MTYSQLREEIRKLAGWGFNTEDAIKEYTEDIMTAIDTYLEEKAVEVAEKRNKFAKDANTESHGAYFERGLNIAYGEAATIIRSKE